MALSPTQAANTPLPPVAETKAAMGAMISKELLAQGLVPGTKEFNDAYKQRLMDGPAEPTTYRQMGNKKPNTALAETLLVADPANTMLKMFITAAKAK